MIAQRISFITIGVGDLDRMKKWYKEAFGWAPLKDDEGICFFGLNGCIFGLYPAADLAADAGIAQDGSGFKRFTLAINLSSTAEVDRAFESLREKDVRIVRPPEKVVWGGYRGYIADPEHNYWEIVYNPHVPLDDAGNVLTHT